MNTMATSIPFSIRLDSEIKDLLDTEAKREDRSASYLAVEAIKNYLEARKTERQVIQAAIEKADRGEFVSSESVRTWFASLGTDNELPKPKADVFLNKKA